MDPITETSYIAYKAGSINKVINTETGNVDYFGSNARTVLQDALDVIAGTGKKLSVKANNTFVLDDSLHADWYTQIEGEGWQTTSQLRANGDFPAIIIDSSTTTHNILRTCLKNLYLSHNSPTYNDIGLIEINTAPGINKTVTRINIDGCYFYDFEKKKGNAIRFTNNDSPIYLVNIHDCEIYGFKDSIFVDILQNNSNSWINNCHFRNINAWVPDGSGFKVSSIGTTAAFDGNGFDNYRIQSGANNIGFDFETTHKGHSWYTTFIDSFVWDSTGTRDAWKFNNICEVTLIGCTPDWRIGGAGATNGKIVKYSQYSRRSGIFQANGNGRKSKFTVYTGFPSTGGTIIPTLRHVSITPLHADIQPTKRTYIWTSNNASSFDIIYNTPPPSGTNNVKFSWEAAM